MKKIPIWLLVLKKSYLYCFKVEDMPEPARLKDNWISLNIDWIDSKSKGVTLLSEDVYDVSCTEDGMICYTDKVKDENGEIVLNYYTYNVYTKQVEYA